jgi:hypothetical protein
VKYADDLVLLATEEAVLQGTIEGLMEIGTWHGKEKNVEKSKVMGISRQPSTMRITIHQKQAENVEYFSSLGSMITNDARCTGEIKSRTATAKVAHQEEDLFTSKLDLELRKKRVKYYTWSMALSGAEI